MTRTLAALDTRALDLIFLLRHPLPGLSPSERDLVYAQRRDRWNREESDLTAGEEHIVDEMQAGFEHAEPGDDDLWDRIWETRKRDFLEREKKAAPQTDNGSNNAARPASSRENKNSNGSSLKERPKPSSVDQPLAPVSAPSPASSPNDGASNAASLKGKTAARDGTTAKNQAAVQKLLVGITWENVKACSIRERSNYAKKLVAADPEWRGSVQPFFPVSLSASASVKSALTVLDTSTNTLITKLAGNTMEPAALVHGFDSLALLVRLRTLQACASARDPDDFELELFQAWLKEKDGRTVERLLVASLLSNEVGHRKSDAIKRSAVPTSDAAFDSTSDLSAPGPSKRQKRRGTSSTSLSENHSDSD